MLPGQTKTLFATGSGESGNDQYTVLLMHFEGDYIDYSLGATGGSVRTFIRRTGARRSAVSWGSFRFGKTCLYVGDAASSGISTPHHADFAFGAGDFTIDYWCYRPGTAACIHFAKRTNTVNGYAPWLILDTGSGNLVFYSSSNGTAWDIASAVPLGTVPPNAWAHVAVVRNGNTIQGYINGVKSGTTITTTATLWADTGLLCIGGDNNANSTPYYFDEIRVSKGIARWSAAFTPATKPYGPNPNRDMLLLIHFDHANGTIIENVTESSVFNRKPFYKDGDVTVVNPGGGIGPGRGNFPGAYFVPNQTVDFDFMENDFTIEWWEARSDPTNGTYPAFTRDNSAIIYQSFLIGWNEAGIGKFYWSLDGSTWGAGAPLVMGALSGSWTHFAIVRKDNTFYSFRNGIQQDSRVVAAGTSLVPATGNQYLAIGFWNYGPGYKYNGYMDEIRIDKVARYTSNFTPSNIPYGYDPVLYSQVLYITADGSIVDSSPWQRPVGNSGVALDNNTMRFIPNSYLYIAGTPELQVRNKDFTIEMWVMARTVTAGGTQWFYTHNNNSTSTSNGMFLGYNSAGSFHAAINVAGSSVLSLNTAAGLFALWQWHHYAFVRFGNKWSLFIDGVERATQTLALTVMDFGVGPYIGITPGALTEWMSGFIDNLKFTNGVALYTQNFTPGTAPAIPANVGPATYFSMSAPGTVQVNTWFTVYLQAYNSTGVAVNYNGVVRVWSNDPNLGGRGDIAYNALNGQLSFNVYITAYGNPYYIYAQDITTTGISGNTGGINVPQPVWHESYNGSAGYQEMYMPAGWSYQSNTIEMIGGGAGGASPNGIYAGGNGGGGGAYVIKYNWLGSNQYVGFAVGGGGGQDGVGGSSWFGDSGVVHAGGGQINGGGGPWACDGGYWGGNGGGGGPCGGGGGGGGSSAVGPAGHGGSNAGYQYACSPGGGGGAGGATAGNSFDSFYGSSAGGNNYQGYGGGAGGVHGNVGDPTGGTGVNGGAGGGGNSDSALNAYWGGHGGHGQEWGANLGGGGAGGASSVGPGGYGGAWGGGAGGAGVVGTGGTGYTGLLRLRWYST